MAVPVPRTWVVGEVVTAAYMNGVRDALNYLLAPPLVDLSQNVAQSLPNNSLTAVAWDTEGYDSDGTHSTVTNTTRITFITPGWYQYDGAITFDANTTGYRLAAAYKNAVTYKTGGRLPPSSSQTSIPVSGSMSVVAGDYLEIYALQSSGGALNTFTSNNFRSFCTVRWVST
jgi:hypothetical protein